MSTVSASLRVVPCVVGCLNGSEDAAAITIQLHSDRRLGLRTDAGSLPCILGESDVVRLIFTLGEALWRHAPRPQLPLDPAAPALVVAGHEASAGPGGMSAGAVRRTAPHIRCADRAGSRTAV